MNLRYCPLVCASLEGADVDAQREMVESVAGLIPIGGRNRSEPLFGAVEYDAGTMVLALTPSAPERGERESPDGPVVVVDVPGAAESDRDGHRFGFRFRSSGAACRPTIAEIRLRTEDVRGSTDFYQRVLGLDPLGGDDDHVRFATGAVTLVLEREPEGAGPENARSGAHLLVFLTRSIRDTYADLTETGLAFEHDATVSGLGEGIRFSDPSGHRFCVCQLSPATLSTPTGRTVQQITAGCEGIVSATRR